MIICSCNVISGHDVRAAVNASVSPQTCIEIYGCLGSSAQCGRCVRAIKKIMSDALGHTYDDGCSCND